MPANLFEETASFYDMSDDQASGVGDIQFYFSVIAPTKSVLEVGCGTGRVAIPLAERGNPVTGIDLSAPMLRELDTKIADRPSVRCRLSVRQMDMRTFELGCTFDWIIFPFRVFQALTSDGDRRRCLAGLRRHMHEESRAVLTLFNPQQSILGNWGEKNILSFESNDEASGRTVRFLTDQDWHDREQQIIAATIRCEVHERGALAETLVDTLELGYLYPDQCDRLFAACGLSVVDAYGDYDCRPLRTDEQREQIYILRRTDPEPG